MSSLKVAVFGAGSIGNRHANNVIQLGHHCELFGFRETAEPERVLANGAFDAVIVATSSQVRRELLLPCFQSLIPVYIEKPIAYDTETLELISSLPDNYLKTCFAGFMMRFHPLTEFLWGLDYNDVYSFTFEIGYDVTKWRQNWLFSQSYSSKKDGGGVLLDLCHELDMANLLFAPLKIKDVLSLDHKHYDGVDFSSVVTLCDGNNLFGTVSMDYVSPINRRKLIVRCKDFIDEVDFNEGTYKRMRSDDTLFKTFRYERNEMFIQSINAFFDGVRGNSHQNPLVPTLQSALPSCQLISDAWSRRAFVGSLEVDLT